MEKSTVKYVVNFLKTIMKAKIRSYFIFIWVFCCVSSFCFAEADLPLSSIGSAGEYASSSQTALSLSEMGSAFYGVSQSAATESRSGYVEQVALRFAYKKGMVTITGNIYDWTPVTVSVINETTGAQAEEEDIKIDNNVYGEYTKPLTVYDLPIIEGPNNIKIIATDYFGRETTYAFQSEFSPPNPPTLDAITNPTSEPSQTLKGTKDATTSVWVNGHQAYEETDPTKWSYVYSGLIEGRNTIQIVAKNKDTGGISSAPIIVEIFLDQLPPILAMTSPSDGYVTNNPELEVTGTVSNDVDETLSAVAGVWINGTIKAQIDRSTWTFRATVPLTEGENPIQITAKSVLGHTATLPTVTVTLDTIAPVEPTVNPVISPTGESTQEIIGTKEADTSVWLVGGGQVYPVEGVDTETDWSYTATLTPKQTATFQFYCKDKAGNPSGPSEQVAIFYDDTAPVAVSVQDDGEYTSGSDQLHVTFEFSEDYTEIIEYFVAVGTTQGGEETLAFTSVGVDTSPIITGLSLQHGTKYYLTVKAKNSVGLESEGYSTDGIWLNQSIPVIDTESLEPPDMYQYYKGDQITFYAEATDADGDSLEFQFEVIDQRTQIQEFFQDFAPLVYPYPKWVTGDDTIIGTKWVYVRVRDNHGAVVEHGGDGIWEIAVLNTKLKSPGE